MGTPANPIDVTTSGAVTFNGTAFSGGTLTVPNGGTGDTSFTAYAPICGGTTTTGALQVASSGISNSGYVLTSTGSSSLPTWQASSSGGPTWTTDTKSYTISSTWQNAGVQSSSIVTGLPGTPSVVLPQCTYLVNNTSGGNGWGITLDNAFSHAYLYTLINGTWAYSTALALTYTQYAEVVSDGTGNIVLLQTSAPIGGGGGSYTVDVYPISGGAFGTKVNINSGSVSSLSANTPCGLTINNNALAWHMNAKIFAYYYSSGAWHAMTNSPVSVTETDGYVQAQCLSLASTNQIMYAYDNSPAYVMTFYDITGGNTLATSAAQTITLSGTGPDGNTHALWSQCYTINDETDATYKYLHVSSPYAGTVSGSATQVGAFYSYENVAGTWTYRNALYPGSTSNSFIGYGQDAQHGLFAGRGGGQAFNSGGSEFLYFNQYNPLQGFLYSLAKTASTPYIAYTLEQNFAWPFTSVANAQNGSAIDTQYGQWLMTFDNNRATGSNQYVRWYPMGSSGTQTVTYQKTTSNLEMQRAYFNDLITLPVLTGGTIGSENIVSDPGTLVVNSTIGALQMFYNGVWNVIPFANLGSGGYPSTAYLQNSGDLSLTGHLLNCHGIYLLTGSNTSMGTATLSSGTITVSNTYVTSTSQIFLSRVSISGTAGFLTYTISSGTSFTINSSSGSDASVVNWMIVQQAAY